MVNFIIGEDQKLMMHKIANIIDKTMFNQPFDYVKHCFFDYDDNFFKQITEIKGFKVFILDIEMKSRSGLEVAKIIRENDLNSVIIFSTIYANKGYEILQNEFLSLTFIVKSQNYEKRLTSALQKSLKMIDENKYLVFKIKSQIYQIAYQDILYLCREKLKRKTIIVTDYARIAVNKPLLFFVEKLNDDFVKSHRSCLVNKKRIIKIDKKNNIIYFDNQETIDYLCRSFYVD